jgi:hypothetical protein
MSGHFPLISGTGKDRKPGIFLEARVGQSQLTEEKNRTPIGFDAAGMDAILTESSMRRRRRIFRRKDHWARIAVAKGTPVCLCILNSLLVGDCLLARQKSRWTLSEPSIP